MDEFELIAQIVEDLGASTQAPHIILGPGDDAAIMACTAGTQSVASIDTQVVGRHFPAEAPARLVGYRAVMASVSDLAAMAAQPRYMLIALMLPEVDIAYVRALTRGISEAALECGIVIVGGNLTRGPLSLTLSVHGEVPAGEGVLRQGAQVGDLVQVSGPLGGAGACVRTGHFECSENLDAIQQAYYRPRARVDLVATLRASAHACVDISDGLLQDLSHLLNDRSPGAAIDSDAIPLCKGALLEDALSGGEDYELLATAAVAMPGFVTVGRIVSEPGLRLDGRPVEARGFDHFHG